MRGPQNSARDTNGFQGKFLGEFLGEFRAEFQGESQGEFPGDEGKQAFSGSALGVTPARGHGTRKVSSWRRWQLGWLLCLVGCATAPALKQGLDLEAAGKYEAASTVYRSALKAGGNTSAQAQTRLAAVQAKIAQTRVEEGTQALEEGRLDTALDLAIEAHKLAPDSPQVIGFRDETAHRALTRAQSEARTGNVMEAVNLLERVRKGWPEVESLQERVARDSARLRELLIERVTESDAKFLPGNALLAQLAIERLAPSDPEVRQTTEERLASYRKRSRIPVTLDLQARGSQAQGLSAALSTLTYQSPILAPQLGPKVPDGLHLELSELDDSLRQTQEQGFGTRAIETGVRRVPNPELAQADAELLKLESEIMRLGERIDSLNAEMMTLKGGADKSPLAAELNRVEREHHQKSEQYVAFQEKAASLPKDVEIANFQEVRFPLDLYRRTATLTARLKATSTRTDLPFKVDFPVQGKAEVSCNVHPAYPQYNIAAGILRFDISDGELKSRAQEDLAHQVGLTVDRLVTDVLVLARKNAREHEKEGRKEEALEQWLRVAMSVPGEVPDDAQTALTARGFTSWDRLRARDK